MGADGTKPTGQQDSNNGDAKALKDKELQNKAGMAMVGLMMTTFLMNPAKFFSAMQATIGGANGMSFASLTDPGMFKGLANMMGGLTDQVVAPSEDMTRVQNSALVTMNTQPNLPNNAAGMNAPGAGLSTMTPTGPTGGMVV